MSSTETTPLPGDRLAGAALALGTVGLLLGVTGVALLASVAAIITGAIARERIDAGGSGDRGRATVGMILAAVSYAIWIPVLVVVAIGQS